jgi:hypothetical protein
MKLSPKQHAALVSYARHVLSAVLAVASTGNYQLEDLAKAAVAALIPLAVRWVNPKDAAFGRGTKDAS